MSVRSLSTSSIANNQLRYGNINTTSGAGPVMVEFDYLLHGGGTGGNGGLSGNWFGSGGGAGIARSGTVNLGTGTYYLMIGAGGAGNATSPGLGGTTYFSSTIGQFGFGITSQGGLSNPHNTRPGGSNADYSGGSGSGINAGGGAGAGANGGTFNGGAGFASSITGSSVTRGGGGAGATSGVGGAGGGGNQNASGTANTGSGGGGSSLGAGTAGGNGGSGVIIFRVPTGTSVSFSGGVSQSSTTVGTKTCYTVTAAGPTDTVTIG